jgi:large subunit ribosomal protein L25
VPAEIYGSKENKSVLIDVFELNKQTKDPQFYSNVIDISVDSSKIEVILKDIQRDPEKSHITHIDFLAVDMNKKINVNVPFRFINEDKCVGIKISGGILSHILNEIEISCLPKDIPENIDVDVTNLDLNQSIHLTEITLPDGVEILHGGDKEHDTAVVKCYKPVEEVIEESTEDVVGDEGTTEDSKDAKANESDSSDDKPENKQDNKE